MGYWSAFYLRVTENGQFSRFRLFYTAAKRRLHYWRIAMIRAGFQDCLIQQIPSAAKAARVSAAFGTAKG